VREDRQVDVDQRVGGGESLPRGGDGAEAVDDPRVPADEIGVDGQVLVVRHRRSTRPELDHVDHVQREPGELGQAPGQRGLAAARVAEDRDPSHAGLMRR
jgi:hypothetical protein